MELDKPNSPINWHRTKLPPGLLEELNRRSDAKGAMMALGYLGVCACTGILSFYFWWVENWWAFAAALFAHGTVTSFAINAVHELIHGTVFKTKWPNEFFAALFAFFGVINHKMFWYSHTEHHKYTLHPPDDLEVVVPTYHSTSNYATSFLINVHFYKDFLVNIRYCFGKFIGKWEPVLVPEKAPHRRSKVVNWSRLMILGHLLIGAVSIYYGLWIIPVLVTFTGAYGAWLFYLCNFTQHAGLTENIDDFRLNCRTMYLNPISRFLYWHMNWHIEHHMYAAVPCYNLRKLHYAIKHELPHSCNGLIEAWVEIAYIQYRRKRDDDYRFLAQLPDENGEFNDERTRLQQIRDQADARLLAQASDTLKSGKRWECSICGFIYDEARGMPEEGIAPGTAWEDIPDNWQCPDCGVSKAEFDMVPLSGDREVTEEQLDIEAMVAKKNSTAKPVVIIGSGMAGYGLAREIRKHDATQPITIITQDDGRVYAKPMLSNALAQQKSAADLAHETAEQISKRLNLTILSSCKVSAIDREKKSITTTQGEISYRDLVLATGADPIEIPIKGDAGGKVYRVNDLSDFEIFTAKLTGQQRIVLLGAGLIGCEFANDLALAGHEVSIIDIAETPLNRLVSPEIGQSLREKLTAHGISWHLGTSIESIDGTGENLVCKLSDGTEITADLMLSAVGLKPRTALAESAGLKTDRGILVDPLLRSSDIHIFALGDCAQVEGKVLPFVQPLTICARALGATLGSSETSVHYPVMPVIIKTPSYPIITVPPEPQADGEWVTEETANGQSARFVSAHGDLLGFALAGDACSDKAELIEEMERATEPVA